MVETVSIMRFCTQPERDFIPFICRLTTMRVGSRQMWLLFHAAAILRMVMGLAFHLDARIGLDPNTKCWEIIKISIICTVYSVIWVLFRCRTDRSLDNHFLVAKGCHEVKRWSLFGYFFLCPASWTGCAHKTRYLIHRTDRLSAHIFAQLFYCSFINIRSSIPLYGLWTSFSLHVWFAH